MTNHGDKPPTRRILLGTIAAAHGIRGEVVLRTYTSDPEAIADYGALSDKAGKQIFKIKSLRATPKGVIARIDGVNDRNRAEALRGIDLYVGRECLPGTDAQEYYHADLIGLEARDAAGAVIGEVVSVANFGAGDLLEIRKSGTQQTEFVVFSAANVPQIDIQAGHLVIIMPDLVGEEEPKTAEQPEDEDESPA